MKATTQHPELIHIILSNYYVKITVKLLNCNNEHQPICG